MDERYRTHHTATSKRVEFTLLQALCRVSFFSSLLLPIIFSGEKSISAHLKNVESNRTNFSYVILSMASLDIPTSSN